MKPITTISMYMIIEFIRAIDRNFLSHRHDAVQMSAKWEQSGREPMFLIPVTNGFIKPSLSKMFAYNTWFVRHKLNIEVLQSTADLLNAAHKHPPFFD